MQHFHSLGELKLEASHLAFGAFDGVHRGHQHLIGRLVRGAQAAGVRSVVLTFFPHPSVVLRGRQPAFYITTPDEKAELLAGLGVDVVVTHPFDLDVSHIRAGDFVRRLVDRLGVKKIVMTEDAAMGYKREGNLAFLREAGRELGFEVEVADLLQVEGEVISSTRVREALRSGDVARAARYLGRPFFVTGKVVEGNHRGKSLGVPTANLELWEERAYPARGVYACWATVKGRRLKAAANIGIRPTFESDEANPTIEAHLLDFEGDLYGLEMRLAFVERLRDEEKFPSVEALLEQIRADIERSRGILFDS